MAARRKGGMKLSAICDRLWRDREDPEAEEPPVDQWRRVAIEKWANGDCDGTEQRSADLLDCITPPEDTEEPEEQLAGKGVPSLILLFLILCWCSHGGVTGVVFTLRPTPQR